MGAAWRFMGKEGNVAFHLARKETTILVVSNHSTGIIQNASCNKQSSVPNRRGDLSITNELC